MLTNDLAANLPWEAPPLCYLNPEQQVELKIKAEIRRCRLGDLLWSDETSGILFIVLTGKVRLVSEDGTSRLLQPGEWAGDLLELPGWKARAASNDVQIVQWESQAWAAIPSADLDRFWATQRNLYLPQTDTSPQPVAGFPFVSGVNTAAACLTMVANHLQNAAQLDWVQRQLRGQRPTNVIDAAEKLGLQLRRIETNWQSLRSLNFPALMQWGETTEPHWVVVYAVRGDRLVIADPLEPTQTAQAVP